MYHKPKCPKCATEVYLTERDGVWGYYCPKCETFYPFDADGNWKGGAK